MIKCNQRTLCQRSTSTIESLNFFFFLLDKRSFSNTGMQLNGIGISFFFSFLYITLHSRYVQRYYILKFQIGVCTYTGRYNGQVFFFFLSF